MSDDELVTHDQVMRWLPSDIRAALNPHEHRWISIQELSSARCRQMCTVTHCDAEQWVEY